MVQNKNLQSSIHIYTQKDTMSEIYFKIIHGREECIWQMTHIGHGSVSWIIGIWAESHPSLYFYINLISPFKDFYKTQYPQEDHLRMQLP